MTRSSNMTKSGKDQQGKAIDADSRALPQIIFTGKIKSTVANTRVIIYYILKQSKGTILEFSIETKKVLSLHING